MNLSLTCTSRMSTISACALVFAALVVLGHPGHSASFLGRGGPSALGNQLRRRAYATKSATGSRYGERMVRSTLQSSGKVYGKTQNIN